LAVDLAEIVDLHDVGVAKRDTELRFLDEHADELIVPAERRQDALDDETFLETFDALGRGEEDLGHPARADTIVKDVVPELCSLKLLHPIAAEPANSRAMLSPSPSERPTHARNHGGRRIAQILLTAVLAAYIPARARADDLCRDIARTIDAEAVSTNDPRALMRLAPYVGANAVPALLSRAKGGDEEIAVAAYLAIGLSRHAESLRLLRDAPRPKSPRVRLGRSLALLAIGDGAESSTISHYLYEGTVGERRFTATSLSLMRQKRPQIMLYSSLEDPDELVRLEAARFLIPTQSVRARRSLIDLFKSGSTAQIRNRAANALLKSGHGFRSEELIQLKPAQRIRATMYDATRGRKISLRTLSGQIRSNDPLTRAAAFAAVALLGAETPAHLKRIEKTLTPKANDVPSPEALVTLALLNDSVSLKALETFDRQGAERAVMVLYAFGVAGNARSQLEPEHAGQIARAVESWMMRMLIGEHDIARALVTMERLDPLAGLLLARTRLLGADGRSQRTAVRVIGRSGSLGDVAPLADLAKRGSPSTRSAALVSAARVCAR
jgi:hypothetical protein